MHSRRILWAIVALLTVAPRPLHAQVVEVPTFEVAQPTVGQFIGFTDVATGPDGTIVFIWNEGSEVQQRSAVLTRRFSEQGIPLGPPIRVDSSGYAFGAAISVSPLGGYIAAWSRIDNTAPVGAAIGRLLDATGAPVGAELTLENAFGWPVQVAGLPSGSAFLWYAQGMHIALYDPNGTMISSNAIDYYANGYYIFPYYLDVKPLSDDGAFITTWFNVNAHSSSGRLFGPDAQPLGPAFLLSDRMAVTHVAASPLGGFVVVGSYTDQSDLSSCSSRWSDTNRLFMRRFADDGTPLGDEELIHEAAPNVWVEHTDLDFDAQGELFVVWAEQCAYNCPPGSPHFSPPKACALDANGVPFGPAVSISDIPGGPASTALLANESFVNVWEGLPAPYTERVYANIVRLCEAGATCPPPPPTWTPAPTRTPTPTRTPAPTWTPTPTRTSTPTPAPPRCGDGIVSRGEECDDGNLIDGDGCDHNCTMTRCGNGIITGTEECDDGNLVNGDGCDKHCLIEDCGDGRIEGDEQCDDGNFDDGDGCEWDCTLTPHHDTVVLPVDPLNVKIRGGVDEVSLTLHIQVRNADITPKPEKPGHLVQLVGDDGDCPYGTVADVPDFGRAADEDNGSDYSLVPGGATRTASVPLLIWRYDYDDSDPQVAQRCTLTFTADAVLEDYNNVDPTPENNTIQVELNVYVFPDPDTLMASNRMAAFSPAQVSPTPAPFFIVSAKPAKATLRAGQATLSTKVDVKVTTGGAVGAAQPAQTITVVASDGDCPAGTVSVSDFSPRVAGAQNVVTLGAGKTAGGKLPLTIAAAAFSSPNTKSPARCTALITSTADGTTGPTNHLTKLLIEVTDHNDF